MSNEWPQGAPPKIPESVAAAVVLRPRTAESLRRLKKIAAFDSGGSKKDIECKAANFDFRGDGNKCKGRANRARSPSVRRRRRRRRCQGNVTRESWQIVGDSGGG